MPLLTRTMPSFEGVGAGQTATVRLPVGLRYHQLLIPYSGVTLAQMTEIRVIANGKVFQRITGADVMNDIGLFDGRNAMNGVLTVDFERYGMRTRAGQELTVIDTTEQAVEKITTLTMEIDISASATNPVFGRAKAKQSGAVQGSNPLLKHIRPFGYDPAGSGDYQISDLPPTGAINRIIFKSATAINSLKLERNGYVVFERTASENEVVQADGIRVPQSGYYVIDFTEDGYGQDWLEVQGVQDLRITLDMAGAGHVDAIVEYLNPLSA